MYTIDQIFDMFLSPDKEIRKKGVEAAKSVKYLSVFLQPRDSKFLWWCCAEVLASKSDSELKPYFYNLFMWLQDMNWPGAETIYNRLCTVPKEKILIHYRIALKAANEYHDEPWKAVLVEFKRDSTLRDVDIGK